MSLTLGQMKQIAQPLDEWCQFCNMKMATAKTADDVWACDDCQRAVVEALQKYEQEALEAATVQLRPRKMKPQAAKARAKRRAKRKRTGR